MSELSETRLFVKNIPAQWNEWEVYHYLKQFGVVNNINLPPPKSGTNFRYGFVDFHLSEGANAALASVGCEALHVAGQDRPLHIERCRAITKKSHVDIESSRFQNSHRNVLKEHNSNSVVNWRKKDALKEKSSRQKAPVVQKGEFDYKRCLSSAGTVSSGRAFGHEAVFVKASTLSSSLPFPFDRQSEISVCGNKNPSDFYIQLKDTIPELVDLEKAIQLYCSEKAFEPVKGAEEGEMLVMKSGSSDDSRYRRFIVTKGGNTKIEGLLVDYAVQTTATVEQLFPIDDQFLNRPYYVIPCALYGVMSNSDSWSSEQINFFFETIIDAEISAHPIAFSKERTLITMFVRDSNCWIDLAERMKHLGLCIYNRPMDQYVYSHEDMLSLQNIQMDVDGGFKGLLKSFDILKTKPKNRIDKKTTAV